MSLATRLVVLGAVALAAGGLRAQVVLGPGIVSPSAVAAETRVSIVDLDDDGHLDLVSLNHTVPQLRFGDGRGHFGPNIDVLPQVGMDGMDVGDVNGDGHPDIVGARTGHPSKQFYVLLGHGEEQFELVAADPIGGLMQTNATAVHLSDADGDGDLDALVLTAIGPADSKGSSLFVNDGSAHFAAQPVVVGDVVDACLATDLNADGLPDVIQTTGFFLASSTMDTHVLLGQPGGGFAPGVTWPQTRLLETGDLDLDGELDLLTSGTTTEGLRTRLGTGDGDFLDGFVISEKKWGPGVVLADFDGDGVLDLFLEAQPPKHHHVIWLGDGHGGFAAGDAVVLQLGSVSSNDLLAADVVEDGRIDLVTIIQPEQTKAVKVHENWTYPAGGPLLDLGYAKPPKSNWTNWPILLASGDFAAGDGASFRLFLGLPDAPTVLVAGLSEAFAAFHGGTLVPAPDFVVGPLVSDAQGGAEVQLHWPAGVPGGAQLTLQYWTVIPGPPEKSAASTAVRITAP